jgi:hypothetical protein
MWHHRHEQHGLRGQSPAQRLTNAPAEKIIETESKPPGFLELSGAWG